MKTFRLVGTRNGKISLRVGDWPKGEGSGAEELVCNDCAVRNRGAKRLYELLATDPEACEAAEKLLVQRSFAFGVARGIGVGIADPV